MITATRARRRYVASLWLRRTAAVGAVIASGACLAPAASAKATHANPAGSVKLSRASVKHAGNVVCGRIAKAWVPGQSLPAGYFVSDAQHALTFRALARHAKGQARKRDLASAELYSRRSAEDLSVCTIAGGAVTVTVKSPGNQTATVRTPVSLQIVASDSDGGALNYKATDLPTGLSINPKTGLITGTPTSAGNSPNGYFVDVSVTDASGPSAWMSFQWTIQTPLRFNLTGAIGLALTGDSQSDRARIAHERAHDADVTGSNLDAVSATGALTDAVTSGSATVSHMLYAPNNKLYVLFSNPVDLANTSQPDQSGQPGGCLLAEVDPATGVPSCIDSTLRTINWSAQGNVNPPIQFDDSGAIYYSGWASGSGMMETTVLRKYLDGVTTNLITDNVIVSNFLVLGNGTVLVSGSTESTDQSWLRMISPGDSLEQLEPYSPPFLTFFPDGNVYLGTGSWGGGSAVLRYDTASAQMDPEAWIAGPSVPLDVTSGYFDSETICAEAGVSDITNMWCFEPNTVDWSYQASDGNEFVVAGLLGANHNSIMEYYPTVAFLQSELTDVTVAQGVGNDLVLAGTDASGNYVLTMYNTSTNQETQLIGPSDQIEIYHLSYVADSNEILFDGLRFADNQYVIGSVDLNTDQVNVMATTSGKLSDLQPIG